MKNKFQKITLGVMLLISLFTFSQIAYAGGPDYEEPTEEITENPMTEKEENPLTPDGNATLVDQASDKDGKEFYTFTSPAGNQFFLIIDKQRSDNNVYDDFDARSSCIRVVGIGDVPKRPKEAPC